MKNSDLSVSSAFLILILISILISVSIIICTLSSCTYLDDNRGNSPVNITVKNSINSAVSKTSDDIRDYSPLTSFIRRKNYSPAKYESPNSRYVGADITKDSTMTITSFEKYCGKQDLYANSMKIGNKYPINWILRCISNSKIPVLRIDPQNSDKPYDENLLIKTAKDAGELDMPIFIDFYPYSSDSGYKSREYTDFFKKAFQNFRSYAPNAAIIWSVQSKDVFDCAQYYPGSDYVDWVGISFSEHSPEGEAKNLEYFYYSFHLEKPVILTSVSVSHYSNAEYYTTEAAEEIKRIYKTYAEYPQIKGIIYNSYKETGTSNNFLITDEPLIRDAYKAAVSKFKRNVLQDPHFIRSVFPVYKNGEDYFISAKSLKYEMFIPQSAEKFDIININGDEYYDINTLGAPKYELDSGSDEKEIFYLLEF